MVKTIMVVDDEEDNRTTVKEVLEKNGYEVITANTADDCLEKLKQTKPSLILMDIMMPGTPVKEAIKLIKETKIAYLSVVRVGEAEKEELLKAPNIVGFIQKPFSPESIMEIVNKVMNK